MEAIEGVIQFKIELLGRHLGGRGTLGRTIHYSKRYTITDFRRHGHWVFDAKEI